MSDRHFLFRFFSKSTAPAAASKPVSTPMPRSRQLGQGMTEYIVIVALVAVAAIAVYQSFGRVIRAQTAAIANELAGESSSTALSNASSAAKDASSQIKNKSLKNYGATSR